VLCHRLAVMSTATPSCWRAPARRPSGAGSAASALDGMAVRIPLLSAIPHRSRGAPCPYPPPHGRRRTTHRRPEHTACCHGPDRERLEPSSSAANTAHPNLPLATSTSWDGNNMRFSHLLARPRPTRQLPQRTPAPAADGNAWSQPIAPAPPTPLLFAEPERARRPRQPTRNANPSAAILRDQAAAFTSDRWCRRQSMPRCVGPASRQLKPALDAVEKAEPQNFQDTFP